MSWKNAVVLPHAPIVEAIRIIDSSALQIALVVNAHNQLIGTVTDGDVRRSILRGHSLQDAVEKIMNPQPTTARPQDGNDVLLMLMRSKRLHHIPLVDEDGVLCGVQLLDDLLQIEAQPNWVILMAGGLGTRLGGLTQDCPKPLLKVGTKPILETILLAFAEHGFRKFFLSVNYKAEMVEAHFGDGARWGVEIEYLRETERLGTAGALSLLPEKPGHPVFVMNGDLLTKVNFQQLLQFHTQHHVAATMCVREYDFQVPYGVVKMDEHRIAGIDEKPMQSFFVNAGIYVLNPEALEIIPPRAPFDMTSLFQSLIGSGRETAAFPLREYWLDIGQRADFERANIEFGENFG